MACWRRAPSSGLVSCQSCPRARRTRAPAARSRQRTKTSRGARQGSVHPLATVAGPSSLWRCPSRRRRSPAASTVRSSRRRMSSRPSTSTASAEACSTPPPPTCRGPPARALLRRRRQGLRPLRLPPRGARRRYRDGHRAQDPRRHPHYGARSAVRRHGRRLRACVRVTTPRTDGDLRPSTDACPEFHALARANCPRARPLLGFRCRPCHPRR